MIEFKSEHFGIAFLVLILGSFLAITMYAIFKNWFYTVQDRFKISGIVKQIEDDNRRVDQIYSRWRSIEYDLDKLTKALKDANTVADINWKLEARQRDIDTLKERLAKLETKIAKEKK